MLVIRTVKLNPQTVNTGQVVSISVLVVDVSWMTIRDENSTWQDLMNNYSDWSALKNYTGT